MKVKKVKSIAMTRHAFLMNALRKRSAILQSKKYVNDITVVDDTKAAETASEGSTIDDDPIDTCSDSENGASPISHKKAQSSIVMNIKNKTTKLRERVTIGSTKNDECYNKVNTKAMNALNDECVLEDTMIEESPFAIETCKSHSSDDEKDDAEDTGTQVVPILPADKKRVNEKSKSSKTQETIYYGKYAIELSDSYIEDTRTQLVPIPSAHEQQHNNSSSSITQETIYYGKYAIELSDSYIEDTRTQFVPIPSIDKENANQSFESNLIQDTICDGNSAIKLSADDVCISNEKEKQIALLRSMIKKIVNDEEDTENQVTVPPTDKKEVDENRDRSANIDTISDDRSDIKVSASNLADNNKEDAAIENEERLTSKKNKANENDSNGIPIAEDDKDKNNKSPIKNDSPRPKDSICSPLKDGSNDYDDDNDDDDISIAGLFFKSGAPPEVDYDISPTELFLHIESSDWDKCTSRIQSHPNEVKTWVYRLDKLHKEQIWLMLPIHAAIIAKAPITVVQALLTAYSDGARERNDRGRLPIHMAADNLDPDDEVLSALLTAYPRGIKKRSPYLSAVDVDVKCPLLYKFIENEDWRGAKRRAKYYPCEAMKWVIKRNNNAIVSRSLPVHKAIAKNAPIKLILALLDAFPESVKCVSYEGMIPLRMALESRTNRIDKETEDLLEVLIKATFYPDKVIEYVANDGKDTPLPQQQPRQKHVLADYDSNCPELYKTIKTRDWNGTLNRLVTHPEEARHWVQKKEKTTVLWRHLPLHAALIMKAPYFVIEALLLVYFDAIRCSDNQHLLPLQIALGHFTREDEVVNVLVDAMEDPENVYMRDPQGAIFLTDYDNNPTELFRLIESELWEECVNYASSFLEEAKTWVMRKHDNGTLWWRVLPLHAAILHGSPRGVIKVLLEAYPDAIQCLDNEGLTPLELAKKNKASDDVIGLLMEAEEDGK